MAYSKRIPSVKLSLTECEYNNLVEVLTKNIEESNDEIIKDLATSTKEKLLKYSTPNNFNPKGIEIDIRLYENEVADIISQLLTYLNPRIKNVNYFSVLMKVRENISKCE